MNKLIIPIIVVLIIAAGIGGYFIFQRATPEDKCGDGICDSFENKTEACPEDCGINPSVIKPLNFAVMLHLEGGDFKIVDERHYNAINAELKQIIDLFSKYDAKITIESELPYTEAVNKWGNNQMLYALEKGMGVGTHNDVTSVNSQEELVENYKFIKEKVDAIVGAENNIGCSGGWVPGYDWAEAANKAGFSYLDGAVMAAAQSVPEKNRPINPDTGKPFTDTEISFGSSKNYFHDPLIPDLKDRIYPRRLKDTNDLIGDDSGVLLLTGELDEIVALYEKRKNCFPGCRLTEEDINTLFKTIDYINSIKNDSKVSLLYFHFGLGTIGPPGNLKIIDDWLKQMQEYQNQGKIEWKTMKEVYEEYNKYE